MIYVLKSDEAAARRLVNFDTVGNIHRSGSVTGMRQMYGWKKGGQVRLGQWVYNIGPEAVEKLRAARLVKG